MQIQIWVLIFLLIFTNVYNEYFMLKMYRFIQTSKSRVSKTTHSKQKMLLVSVLLEHYVGLATIAIPALLVMFAISMPIPYGSHLCYVLFILMSFQTLISAFAQCYFIKPFRKGLKELIMLKFIKRSATTAVFYEGSPRHSNVDHRFSSFNQATRRSSNVRNE